MMHLLWAAAPPVDVAALAVPLAAGAAAIYLLLPRPRGRAILAGALCGLAAIVLGGWLLLGRSALSVESILFYVFSAFALVSGGLLVTQQNPARAALSFTLVVLSTSGLFLLLAAPFLMAASVVIYAGAIVVTFLFVLMLAQQAGLSDADARSREPLLATITGFVLLGALLYVLGAAYEHNDNVRLLDEVLAQLREAESRLAAGDQAVLTDLGTRLKEPITRTRDALEKQEDELRQSDDRHFEVRSVQSRAEFARELRERVELLVPDTLDGRTQPADETRLAVTRLSQSLVQLRQQQTWLQPSPGLPLSDLSGPPANLAAERFRYDADGRPHLPAENVHYLGKSLFTDFLLPIELGGTLLLVATVGAIAIAQSRGPREAVR